MKIIILIIVALFAWLHSDAQKKVFDEEIKQIATVKSTKGWYKFDKGIALSGKNINEILHQNKILNSGSELRIQTQLNDLLGFTHTKFNQFSNGYKIQFAQFILHEKNGEQSSGNGSLTTAMDIKNIPVKLSFESALAAAKRKFPASQYAWENPEEEKSIRERTNGKVKSFFPEKELVWLPSDIMNFDAASFRLTYKLTITGGEPSFCKEVYIDAQDGSILKVLEREYTCKTSTFGSNFNGSQTSRFNFRGTVNGFVHNDYVMVDNCSLSNDIYVSNNVNYYFPFSNTTSTWPNTIFYNSAFTSAWATRITQLYFTFVHKRNGFDNRGAGSFKIDLRQNAAFGLSGTNYANASFDQFGRMKIGNHESSGGGPNSHAQDDWNTFDIIAHEFTHGVTYYSSDLVYEKEPGSLNESFSDIFGVSCYQDWGNTNGHVWEVGYDRTSASDNTLHTPLRNMSNPSELGDPDTYYTDNLWVSTTTPTDVGGDNWGVHTNSGVQNIMYFLLCEGGNRTNYNGFTYNVAGIGITKARAIAYRALTVYLTQTSQYQDARAAWIKSAEDLFGACSTESIQTAMAWQAVGLNAPVTASTYAFCGNYGATYLYLVKNGNIQVAGACATTISGSGIIGLTAGSAVIMSPGFTANYGSNYTASINIYCSLADY